MAARYSVVRKRPEVNYSNDTRGGSGPYTSGNVKKAARKHPELFRQVIDDVVENSGHILKKYNLLVAEDFKGMDNESILKKYAGTARNDQPHIAEFSVSEEEVRMKWQVLSKKNPSGGAEVLYKRNNGTPEFSRVEEYFFDL